jgi:CRISPR-associated protein Csd1
VAEAGRRIAAHFSAIEIVGPRPYLPLWQLINCVALKNEAKNLPPNLAADSFRCVLDGLPYPESLMQGAMRRIRAERDVTYPRAALLKAYLNRNLNDQDITVSLNVANTDPGYRLGRLFAVLERIQEQAQGSLNASIRERYYGAFSTTPVTVLPLLMKLKNHHLTKIANPAFLEKTLGEVLEGLDDIPSRLSLAEQARFAVGYYHQRQSFFTKHDGKDTDHSSTDKD